MTRFALCAARLCTAVKNCLALLCDWVQPRTAGYTMFASKSLNAYSIINPWIWLSTTSPLTEGIRTFRNSEASVYLNVSAFVFVDLLKIPPVYLMSVYFLLCCPLKNWETVSVSVYSFGSCVLIQISLRVSVSSLELWGDVTSPAALNRCSEDSDSQSTLSETSRRDSAESGEDKE